MFVRRNAKIGFDFSKKNQNFAPAQQLRFKYYQNKQKQILAQLLRIKKKNLLLNTKFLTLVQQKKTKNLQKSIQNLKKEIFQSRIQIKKLGKFYAFLIDSFNEISKKTKIKKEFKKNIFVNQVERKKLILFWRVLKKKFNSFTRTRFLKFELPTMMFHFHKNFSEKNRKSNFKLCNKNHILKKILHLNFLFTQMFANNSLIKNQFLFLNFKTKSQLLISTSKKEFNKDFLFQNWQRKAFLKIKLNKNKIGKRKATHQLFYNISIWTLLRRIKKKKRKGLKSRFSRKKLKNLRKKVKLNWKLKSYTKYNKFLERNKFLQTENKNQIGNHIKKINLDLKKNRIAKYYKYRLPYRRIYFNFQQMNLSFRFKYLIQDFVQKYFQVQVEAKIEHVLNANKNQNFFRLVFSVRKKKKNQLIKKHRLDTWNQKQMFLMSRLKLITSAKSKKKKIKKKKSATRNVLENLITRNVKHELTKTNVFKVLKKKEFFILAEKKRLKARMSNYFSRLKRPKEFKQIFKYFIPTLMEFSRSFDPQLLADMLAKVILKTNKQTKMLNNIKHLLQAIQLPKNVGYKIVLTGRINSKKKSRLIYITRKQITLQVFENNMNYAYSQANARIGAFGVKI